MKQTKFVNLPRGGYRLGSGKDNFMNKVQVETPNRNRFDLSHQVMMTGRAGNLMPSMVMEVLPGDKISLGCDNLVRLMPMVAPTMDRMDVRTEYFYVPNRIIWPSEGANEGWEKFIANEPNIDLPFITIVDTLTSEQQDFMDYFGVPPIESGGLATEINALPFAAYHMICNEYYRAQYVDEEIPFKLVDGDNNASIADLLTMHRRVYDNDYFIAGLPTPQKGTAVQLPGGEIILDPNWSSVTSVPTFETDVPTIPVGDLEMQGGQIQTTPGPAGPLAYNPDGTLIGAPVTINDLRLAEALQKWLEMFMRVGSRYTELIHGFFGINVEDYRLDRPEFLVGSKAPVIVSEVLNTAGETGGLPQGNMAGHGIVVMEGYQDEYFVKEHGYIIGITSAMPVATYCEGLERHWLRKDANDYFWSQFEHLGEQSVQNQELVAYRANPTGTFAYMPRYAEYRTMKNRIAGEFRDSLQPWTFARLFGASTPQLNSAFLRLNDEDVDRVFAVDMSANDYLMMHLRHKIMATRPIGVYGTPQLV